MFHICLYAFRLFFNYIALWFTAKHGDVIAEAQRRVLHTHKFSKVPVLLKACISKMNRTDFTANYVKRCSLLMKSTFYRL